MLSILEDYQESIVKGQKKINFSSFSSFHLIVITARAKSEKQVSKDSTDDEDLIVKIDGKTYPKLSDSARLVDSPAAFSGGSLHNLGKTVYFLTFLKGKEHMVELLTDSSQSSAILECVKVYALNLKQELAIKVEKQAEDGDRWPWITLVLDALPLDFISTTTTYSRRKRDSDDVKIIFDGVVKRNLARTVKHFLWRYAGSLLSDSSPKKETETFPVSFPSALHYIEFWADRLPTLHSLTLNFGILPPPPKGIPSVDEPAWTKDFFDDTEEMLLARAIYGEAGGQSFEEKVAVGWAIKNRVRDSKKRWGRSFHEVILQPFQYEPFNDPEDKVFKKITNPPMDNSLEKRAWLDSFQVARAVIFGETPDPTLGANHFHAVSMSSWPPWAIDDVFTVEIGKSRFYKL